MEISICLGFRISGLEFRTKRKVSKADQNNKTKGVFSGERAHIENHIKEIKSGFGMEYLPSGDSSANAVHFAIGIMTYNLFIAQKLLVMPEGWSDKTIKSIRWLFVEVPGKLIQHSRRIILNIAASTGKYNIYLEMRRRTYALSPG